MKRKLALGIYICVCIILLIIKCGEQTENYLEERYGTSADDTISLEIGEELDIDFVLTNSVFEGIRIRFQTENEFVNEILVAKLYDYETDVLLVEDSILLKYECIQNKDSGSTIFLQLPVEDCKDKRVRLRLQLDGENARIPISFVLSNSCVNEAKLRHENEVIDKNLLFYTRYQLESSNNVIAVLMEGIFCLSIGWLVFYFSNKLLYNVEIPARTDFIDKKNNVNDSKICWKKIWFGILGLGCLCIALIYIYDYHIEWAMAQTDTEVIVSEEDYNLEVSEDTNIIKQVVYCQKANLSSISFPMKIEKVGESALLKINVIDETIGKTIVSEVYNVKETGSNEKKVDINIVFKETYENVAKHLLSIEIEPVDFQNTSIYICTGDVKSKKSNIKEVTQLFVDNEIRDTNISISLEFGNLDFLSKVFAVFAVWLVISFIVIYVFCVLKEKRIENVFIVVALFLGIAFCFLIGLGTVPDEPSHIDTAYSISNEILGIPTSNKPGYIYKRVEDIDPNIENKQNLNVYHYERLNSQLFSLSKDSTLVECSVRSNLNNAGKIYYIPQALGISVGRIIGLGYLPTMMMGRLFSLFVYILLAYLAIRIMPFGKTSLAIIAVLPISLQQAASFSYDAIINSIAYIYVACCLAFIYEYRAVKKKYIMCIIFSGILLGSVKGGVYIPMCFLPLLAIFERKDLSKRIKTGIICIVAVCLFSFGKENIISLLNRFSAVQGTVTGGASSSEIYTFGYILKNPLHLIGMFANTIYKQGDSYLRNILGGNLGWRNVNISWFIVFGFLLILLVSCMAEKGEVNIKRSNKIYIATICLGCYFCIQLSMLLAWTPVSFRYITGVQGRYFIPVFVLLLITIRNKFFILKRNVDHILIFVCAILNIMTCCQIIQIVSG